MSADWSAVPAPVPYANLTNPQTLNLYALVHENPSTFADLDGHLAPGQLGDPGGMAVQPRMRGANGNSYGCLDTGCDSQVSEVTQTFEVATITVEYFESGETETSITYGQPPAQNTSQTETQPQTQTQPKQLSAGDVSKAIQSARDEPKGTPHAKSAVDFLNALGKNWNLSGDTLRQGLKDSKVEDHDVYKKVDSVSRTGDKVTVQLNSTINYLIYKTGKTITFDVGSVGGRPALVNIQGVEAFHGFHYVPKLTTGRIRA